MLLRSSRLAEAMTKEAFGRMALNFAKRVGGDVKNLGQARKMVGAGQGKVQGTLKQWAPKTLVGKGAKLVAKHPMGSAGVIGGAAVAGGAAAKAFKPMMQGHDPYALQRRRMQGFRS